MEKERLDLIEKIKGMSNLSENFNGYGAKPISKEVIEKALDLAKVLCPIPKVFPTGRESLQFEWENDSLYLEMEIYKDKIEICNMIQENDKGMEGAIECIQRRSKLSKKLSKN